MNYYPHHIGDFNSATRHLTRVERALYRDLIELYYDTEQPLPAGDFDRLARRVIAVTEQEITALKYVLEEFFQLEGGVYRNARCDLEIEKYRNVNSAKARAGKASAEARKAKKEPPIEHNSTGVEQVLNACATNQEPRTKNQIKDMSEKSDASSPSGQQDDSKKQFEKKLLDNLFESFWEKYPHKESKQPAKKSWCSFMRGKSEIEIRKWSSLMLNYYADRSEKNEAESNGFNPLARKLASSFINQRQWEDDPDWMKRFEEKWAEYQQQKTGASNGTTN